MLKKTLHPEKQMNIIDQCNIIGEALAEGGTYYGNGEGLAIYLEISQSKVYQMHAVYRNMIPELKEWFKSTEYQCRTAYDKAVLTPESQREFLEGMNILIDGGFRPPRSNTSETTIINKEEN